MTPYYQDASVTLYHGDCREVLPTLQEVDHVMTDPPYSDDTHDGARTGSAQNNGVLVTFGSTNSEAIGLVLGSIRARRWAVLSVDWQHVLPLKLSPPSGWKFVRHGVWVKPNGTPQFTGDRPGQGWEAVAILHADVKGRMKWNGGGLPATWTHCKVAGLHPTGKPEPLLLDWVAQFTDPGETILDPFMGSGTTLTAAKRLGRKAIGIEREEKYCEVAARRLSQGALTAMFDTDPLRDEVIVQAVK